MGELKWTEGEDGFTADEHGCKLVVEFRARGKWRWQVVSPDWSAKGTATTLTQAQWFCEHLAEWEAESSG